MIFNLPARTHHLHVCCRFGFVRLFVTLRTVARQAPLSTGFSRQEYWSELPFPPGDSSDPGILHWQADSLPLGSLFTPWEASAMAPVAESLLSNLQAEKGTAVVLKDF